MKGAMLHAPGDVRFEDVATPRIVEPTDAILICMAVRCLCAGFCHASSS
jgi:hypothetical protein